MQQREFYINYTNSNNELITTKLQARSDILDIIKRSLKDNDPIAKDLVDDVIKVHALLQGVDYKSGSLYIPEDYLLN